ncbi:hypothetical protein [Nocardia yamanashiensis]|uniref:hypothetical protein n=1 Tax=Nocardia yamanashiensis TaxID=209247 RepID=UPI000835BFF9|nr:hypothetical protein [Nocardia yamanashiensis]
MSKFVTRRRTAGFAGLVAAAAATLSIVAPSASAQGLELTEAPAAAAEVVTADPVCAVVSDNIDLSGICTDVRRGHRPSLSAH